MKTILKTLTGSQAHGLATPESDYDYRGVFVVPTVELLKLGQSKSITSHINGKEDDTNWEIGHFLYLATKCNPTILEVFNSPIIEEDGYISQKLLALFPYIWNSTGILNAFLGYGLSQRKKFLDGYDGRKNKYATAYLRTLYTGTVLLETGVIPIDMTDTPIFSTLKAWKMGHFDLDEVLAVSLEWEDKFKLAHSKNPNKKADLDRVNKFLIDTRYLMWKNI